MTKRRLILVGLGGLVITALGVSTVLAQDGTLGGKARRRGHQRRRRGDDRFGPLRLRRDRAGRRDGGDIPA